LSKEVRPSDESGREAFIEFEARHKLKFKKVCDEEILK